ncbi:MAG: hypothetical protein JWN48_5017 [Myxococcaceae bacterium]|nr:hypothetical protein [Myxococcaceae bacterium]
MNAIEEENPIPETAHTTEREQDGALPSARLIAEGDTRDEDALTVDDSELSVESRELTAAAELALESSPLASTESEASEAERPTRRKLEEQLEALKRKEVELRRALVMADHPELADSIRILQGRAYALERVEAKLALGLSKAELRRRETLQKKLSSLHEKRTELDLQISEVTAELDGLGVERQQGFEAERRQALEELLVALSTHDPALHAAGIEATELVPEIGRWLPEVETLAESLVSKRIQAN